MRTGGGDKTGLTGSNFSPSVLTVFQWKHFPVDVGFDVATDDAVVAAVVVDVVVAFVVDVVATDDAVAVVHHIVVVSILKVKFLCFSQGKV